MAQHLVKIILLGAQIASRAFAKALRNEFQSGRVAQEARKQTTEQVQTNRLTGMTLEEAKQILNVSELDALKIQEKYDTLFKLNDKTNGGSFYLQSKIYRAKERLDEEFKQVQQNQKEQTK